MGHTGTVTCHQIKVIKMEIIPCSTILQVLQTLKKKQQVFNSYFIVVIFEMIRFLEAYFDILEEELLRVEPFNPFLRRQYYLSWIDSKTYVTV